MERMEEPDDLHLARYRFAAQFAQNRRVLDAACGVGYGCSMLKAAGATSVVGADVSAHAVDHARSRHAAPGITFYVAECFEIDGLFDLVVSLETIEHLERAVDWPEKIHSLLSPGGLAILSTPIRRKGSLTDRPENPYHLVEWNISEFVALLTTAFRDVSLRLQGFDAPTVQGTFITRPFRRGLLVRDMVRAGPREVLAIDEWFERFRFRPMFMVALCRP